MLRRVLVLALVLTGVCGGQDLSPELAHRMEAILRAKVRFAPGTSVQFGTRKASEIPGYDSVEVKYTSLDGGAGTIALLVSKDGTKMAQFTSYNIQVDPKVGFPQGDRPARGGPVGAPVEIVNYDDLECPFCARLHGSIFPALIDRYKDQVRIVYRSYPSDGHPWAMRAAIDTDCLAAESVQAFWAAVDKMHATAADYGGPERSIKVAEKQVDDEVRGIGRVFGVEPRGLEACIAAQDQRAERASLEVGAALGVSQTPTMFINGVKIEGSVPLEFLFAAIDQALVAAGKVPPAKYVAPAAK
jgi:protein-disulfide isomerase